MWIWGVVMKRLLRCSLIIKFSHELEPHYWLHSHVALFIGCRMKVGTVCFLFTGPRSCHNAMRNASRYATAVRKHISLQKTKMWGIHFSFFVHQGSNRTIRKRLWPHFTHQERNKSRVIEEPSPVSFLLPRNVGKSDQWKGDFLKI